HHFLGLSPPSRPASRAEAKPRRERPRLAPPDWLHRPAPIEARPPRPLAPSSLGIDDVPNPPPSEAMRAAARRGTLLHALFERLPAVVPERRRTAAIRWLTGSGGIEDDGIAHALTEDACRVIEDPRFSALFGAEALAEAPVAAVVEGSVVAGTVDRLLIEPDRILVVDFKTGRRVPDRIEEAPTHHIRQMAAYAAALSTIFPGRAIEAALLYTAGPSLLLLPPDLIEAHKPGFRAEEQNHAQGR
ncbi:MAG: PD-(D/E)XK nuclease family protein, partial [Alphaproteobacteria bacterium]